MAWLIVAVSLFAGSIVAAVLQSGGVSAALALVAIAVAVAGQLLSAGDAPKPNDRLRGNVDDDPHPARDGH